MNGEKGQVRTGLILGFLAYAAWGLLSPIGKHLLDDFDPLALNAVRFVIATVLFLLIIGPERVRVSLQLLGRREILWINLLANASLTLFLYSLTVLDATYSTLGFYTAPLWTSALAALLLKEKVGPWFVPAVVAMLAGGYLALFGITRPGHIDGFGILLAIGSAVLWAFYTVGLRSAAPTVRLRPLLGAGFIFGALYYSVLSLAIEGVPRLTGHSPAVWGWMAIYVLGPSLASFILFNAAIQRAPAGLVNLLVGAELGFTVLFSYLILNDKFDLAQLAGLALVLIAVTAYLWSQRGKSEIRQEVVPGPT